MVAIIISPPFTRLSNCPYPHPRIRAKGVAKGSPAKARRDRRHPLERLIVAPKRPEMIPSGRPKLRPQPL